MMKEIEMYWTGVRYIMEKGDADQLRMLRNEIDRLIEKRSKKEENKEENPAPKKKIRLVSGKMYSYIEDEEDFS